MTAGSRALITRFVLHATTPQSATVHRKHESINTYMRNYCFTADNDNLLPNTIYS